MAISPDGATVAVATSGAVATSLDPDPEITIWTRDGRDHAAFDSQSPVTALAISGEGLLVVAGNRAVHIWDLARPADSLLSLTPGISRVDQLRFDPGNGSLLAVGGPNDVELWDVAARARVAALPTAEGTFGGIPLALGGKTLALGLPSSLALWSVVDPKVQVQIAGFRQGLISLAFSPSGELAMAGYDGEVRLWSSGLCPTTARAVESVRANALAFDAAGRLLAQDRDQLLWLAEDGRQLARAALPKAMVRGPRGGIFPSLPPTSGRIARSADGRTLAMTRGTEVLLGRLKEDGSPGPIVRLDSPDLPEPDGPDGPPRGGRGGSGMNPLRDVALSPDGRRLFLASSEGIGAWSIDGDRLVRLPWSPPARLSHLAIAPDGRTLAVGDRAGAVLLIDPADGRVRHRLEAAEEGGGFIHSLAFSPDGRELAVGSRDQIRLWSLEGPAPLPLARLAGHHGPVSALAYDAQGRHLASGSHDKTVKVWDLDHVRGELARLGLD